MECPDSDHSEAVLLVENDPDAVELTRRAFERCGIENPLLVVRDGVEALDSLLAHDARLPGLILLDLDLPRLGGLEVLSRLRKGASTQVVPVVVLSTSEECRDVLESYRRGANSFVRKPVAFSEFVDVLRQLVAYWLVLNRRPCEGSA